MALYDTLALPDSSPSIHLPPINHLRGNLGDGWRRRGDRSKPQRKNIPGCRAVGEMDYLRISRHGTVLASLRPYGASSLPRVSAASLVRR